MQHISQLTEVESTNWIHPRRQSSVRQLRITGCSRPRAAENVKSANSDLTAQTLS